MAADRLPPGLLSAQLARQQAPPKLQGAPAAPEASDTFGMSPATCAAILDGQVNDVAFGSWLACWWERWHASWPKETDAPDKHSAVKSKKAEGEDIKGAWGRFAQTFVTFSLKLDNVSRKELEQRPQLCGILEEAVRATIAMYVGVSRVNVSVAATDAQVLLLCKLTLKAEEDGEKVRSKVHRSDHFRHLVSGVVTRLPGIELATTGPVASGWVEDDDLSFGAPPTTSGPFTTYSWVRLLNFELIIVGTALLSLLCSYTLPNNVADLGYFASMQHGEITDDVRERAIIYVSANGHSHQVQH